MQSMAAGRGFSPTYERPGRLLGGRGMPHEPHRTSRLMLMNLLAAAASPRRSIAGVDPGEDVTQIDTYVQRVLTATSASPPTNDAYSLHRRPALGSRDGPIGL